MARPPSAAVARRNQQIYAEWRDGGTLTELAEQYGRTPQQIGRIVAAFHPDLDDEDDRALHRGRLERLYGQVEGIFASPGWKMSPTGTPASGPGGEPAEDVMVNLEAGKLTLQVLESMRRLDGRDKQQTQKRMADEEARRRAAESLAVLAAAVAGRNAALEEKHRRELEEVRRAVSPAVVAGEVLREGQEQQRREGR